MKKKFKSLFSLNPTSITTALIILVIILSITGIPLLDLMELKSLDLRFTSRGIKKPTPEIVLAVLDEKSVDKEGRWPWPRSKVAKLVDKLSQDGTKVIGFDIFFSEPDQNTSLNLLRQLDDDGVRVEGQVDDQAPQVQDEPLVEVVGRDVDPHRQRPVEALVPLGQLAAGPGDDLGVELAR